MRIADAFLAEWARLQPGGRIDAREIGVDTHTASAFPTTLEYIALVLRLEFSPSECERAHQVRIDFLDPDGHLLAQESGVVVPPAHPNERYRPTVVPIIWHAADLSMPAPGDYAFHILVHELEFAVVPLFVRLGRQGEGSDEQARGQVRT